MVDRIEALRQQTELTGIDFVSIEVDPSPVTGACFVDVYWHVEPDAIDRPLVGDITPDQIAVTSRFARDAARVAVNAITWPSADGRTLARIELATFGEFVPYRLAIDDDRIDPFFNDRPFSFQAGCPSRLDCRPVEPICVDDLPQPPPIDYTARDQWSLGRAMLDAATVLEPAWTDRAAADQLVMLTETLASIGDELSYTQDRHRDEASFRHATQLRSLRRHAQLVDHQMHNGLGASGWLVVTVDGAAVGGAGVGIGNLAAGTTVWAEDERGAATEFSIGVGLRDELDGNVYQVNAVRNALVPHIADDGLGCLPAGATRITVDGHVGAAFGSLGDRPRMIALHERPSSAGTPARTWYVGVIAATETSDALVGAASPHPITHLDWNAADAPPFDFQLADTTVFGNLVPFTVGRTTTVDAVIGPDIGGLGLASAIERAGPDGTTQYLVSLPGSDTVPLAWRPVDDTIGGGDIRRTRPEMVLHERRDPDPPVEWEWRPHLVGPAASSPDDRHVTLDDGTWGTAVTYRRLGSTIEHADWLNGDGLTIRFGDGEFASPPPVGARFTASYRLGNGAAGNVPAGAIRHIDAADPLVIAVTNLTATVDGTDAESVAEMKRVAPHLWQAVTYRAVRTEDYAEALTRLDWVQQAGAVAAWTGSWLSIVATPDPRDAVALTDRWRAAAVDQIDRFRQAGRDALIGEPRYADLDIDIELCVEPSAYRGDALEAVIVALLGDRRRDPSGRGDQAFFDPDRFVFGRPLYRAALEAAVQSAAGVRAVDAITYRRRGHFDWRPMPAVVTVAADELIRVVNDVTQPARGTVRLIANGGA